MIAKSEIQVLDLEDIELEPKQIIKLCNIKTLKSRNIYSKDFWWILKWLFIAEHNSLQKKLFCPS